MNPDEVTEPSEFDRSLDAVEEYDVIVMIERDRKTVAVMMSPERYAELLGRVQ